MVGLLIVNLLVSIVLVCTVITMTCVVEKHVDESLCELMTAVFNAEEIKTRAKEAAEKGEGSIEI